MKIHETYSQYLNERTAKEVHHDAINALTKTIPGNKLDKRYVKEYLKSIEQMARKNPRNFVKDYGEFGVSDWLEDVEYNMQNESKVNEGDKGTVAAENREKLKAYAEKIQKAGDSADKARDAEKKAEEKGDDEAQAVARINLQKANAQTTIAKADARLFKHKLSKEREKKKNESNIFETSSIPQSEIIKLYNQYWK